MRMLTLSFAAAAALALALTPAAAAQQENTGRVRQAWLRAQSRQQAVAKKERLLAKAEAWAAQRSAQKQRDAWITAHAPELMPAPDRAAARQANGQASQAVQRAAAVSDQALDLDSDQGRARPRTRQQIKDQREKVMQWQQRHQQGASRAPHGAQSQAAAPSRGAGQPQRAVRPAGGRVQRASDQPSTRAAARPQGSRER